MTKATYTRAGNFLIPNIIVPDTPTEPLGKYGRMHERHLKERHPVLYNVLLLSGKLQPHLQEIDVAARYRMKTLISQSMQVAGATEELKAADPLRWAGLMNTPKAQAEEIVLVELIFPERQ